MKLTRTIGLTAALATVVAGLTLTTADAASPRRAFSAPTVGEFVAKHGVGAAKALNPELTTTEIADLAQDPTARIARNGFVFYVEPIRAFSALRTPSSIPTPVSDIALEDYDSLNSLPGSNRTILLDFDGHVVPPGTYWDDPTPGSPIVSGEYPAFSLDGDEQFNDAEKQIIIDTWARGGRGLRALRCRRGRRGWLPGAASGACLSSCGRSARVQGRVREPSVAAPPCHLLQVTTEDPGVDALRKSTSSDVNYGIRVCIGGSSYDW